MARDNNLGSWYCDIAGKSTAHDACIPYVHKFNSPTARLPIQLPTNTPVNAAKDGTSTLGACTHVRDLEEGSGSWLQCGPFLAFRVIYGVIQHAEHLPSLYSHLLALSYINIYVYHALSLSLIYISL